MNHRSGCYRYRGEEFGASERVVPAIVLLAVGAIFLLHNFNIVFASEIFQYWPAILIAVGIVKLVDSEHTGGRVGGGVLIGLGSLLMARNLGYVEVAFWDLWPVIPIALGVLLLFDHSPSWKLGANTRTGIAMKEAAVFSGGKRRILDQNFRSAKYDAVFGGYEIDLRKAEIAEDAATLELNAVFGGIEVKVPESWSVVMKGAGVFGGFVNNTMEPDPRLYPAPKQLIVKGGAVFGGVEVKN
jgi:hypothetical protein